MKEPAPTGFEPFSVRIIAHSEAKADAGLRLWDPNITVHHCVARCAAVHSQRAFHPDDSAQSCTVCEAGHCYKQHSVLYGISPLIPEGILTAMDRLYLEHCHPSGRQVLTAHWAPASTRLACRPVSQAFARAFLPSRSG